LEDSKNTKINIIKDRINKIRNFNIWSKYYDNDHLWSWYFVKGYKQIITLIKKYSISINKSLDIGCGTGGLELMLSENFSKFDIVGVDISDEMIKIAKNKTKDPRINYICSDINDISYEDSTFDQIFILNNLHHFVNINDFLLKICKWLEIDGYLFLLDPNNDNIFRKGWVLLLKNIFFRNEGIVQYHSFKKIEHFLLHEKYIKIESINFYYFSRLCIYKKTK
jgi:ubiquinone/menaquinone biosynthesis C-methylase UbiE